MTNTYRHSIGPASISSTPPKASSESRQPAFSYSRHYELECLIFASGFELPMTSYANRAGFDAVDRDEITLSKHWANGMRYMFGVHMHGLPNLFHVGYSLPAAQRLARRGQVRRSRASIPSTAKSGQPRLAKVVHRSHR
jgi:hypothetical protein